MSQAPRPATLQVVGLVGAFLGLGMSGALPPALLPVLGDELGDSAQRLSLVLSALFAGLCIGVLVTAVAGPALPSPVTVSMGALVQAAGLIGLAAAGSALGAVVAGLVLGVGFGATELSAMAAARSAETAAGRWLSHLTAVLAVTSALTPLVFGLLAASGYWRVTLVAAATVHVATALAVLALGRREPRPRPVAWRAAVQLRRGHLAVFYYVGGETAIAAWIARLADSALGLQAAAAAAATALFWGSLAAGRILAGHLLGRGLTAGRLLPVALLCAATCLGLAAVLPGVPRLVLLICGLVSAGPAYGLIVATTEGSGDRRVLAVLIAAGALGGALVSAAAAAAHDLAGLAGVLLLAGAMFGAAVLAVAGVPGRRGPRPASVTGGLAR